MGIVKTALKSSADPWRGAEMTFIDSATIIFSPSQSDVMELKFMLRNYFERLSP